MAARYTARGQALLEKLGNALPGLRPLAENDFPALLALYKSNPFYLSISQEGPPTLEDCQEDAAALPPGRGKEHKLFLGLFQESVLAAVLDLVEGYPEEAPSISACWSWQVPCRERALAHTSSAPFPKRPGLRGSSAYVLPAWRKTSPGWPFGPAWALKRKAAAPF